MPLTLSVVGALDQRVLSIRKPSTIRSKSEHDRNLESGFRAPSPYEALGDILPTGKRSPLHNGRRLLCPDVWDDTIPPLAYQIKPHTPVHEQFVKIPTTLKFYPSDLPG